MSQALHGYLLEVASAGRASSTCRACSRACASFRSAVRAARRSARSRSFRTSRSASSRENELRAAIEAAQAANAAKSNFFAAMSHELRTPIGAMSGYADLLATGIFGPDQRPAARAARCASRRVASHLQQHRERDSLVRARRRASRGGRARPTSMPACSPTRRSSRSSRSPRRKGLAVRQRFPSDADSIRTDQVKVRQILINLLGNAIKFTERGSIELEVSVTEDRRRSRSACSTPAAASRRATSRRSSSRSRASRGKDDQPNPGSGLGLARQPRARPSARRRHHGGERDRRGSAFTATLPLATARD